MPSGKAPKKKSENYGLTRTIVRPVTVGKKRSSIATSHPGPSASQNASFDKIKKKKAK